MHNALRVLAGRPIGLILHSNAWFFSRVSLQRAGGNEELL